MKMLLEYSYKEVLDAVKHQDDKIGRLFAGVSFLTAASLAMANLGGSAYLSQRYEEWSDVPLAMLTLAAFLLLVVASVMLLMGSLATPLRVPGLSRGPRPLDIDWVTGVERSSQIYFGEIARLSLNEWEDKWTHSKKKLETELAQSLVKETHNLAVRTQFKYNRMNEAITLFNLGLLFLSLTMVLCVRAASAAAPIGQLISISAAARWSLAATVAGFFLVQLMGQVRYSRQTVDELYGWENRLGGILRYVWVTGATVFVLLVGSSSLRDRPGVWLVGVVGLVAVLALAVGVVLQRRVKKVSAGSELQQWIGTAAAFACFVIIWILASRSDEWYDGGLFNLCVVVAAAGVLTLFGLAGPSLSHQKTIAKYRERAANHQPTSGNQGDGESSGTGPADSGRTTASSS